MAPPRPQKVPQKLPTHYLIISWVGLPIFSVLLTIGLFGLAVILDEEKTNAISRSQFGQMYWKLIQTNPYISAMTVNGGGLGVLVCGAGLIEHYKAKKLEAAAAASASAKKDTKKTK